MAEFKILQENGVDIYPITHPNAVMDENGNHAIVDAPSDGKTYGRNNGAWAEVQGGGSSALTLVNDITLEEEIKIIDITLDVPATSDIVFYIEAKPNISGSINWVSFNFNSITGDGLRLGSLQPNTGTKYSLVYFKRLKGFSWVFDHGIQNNNTAAAYQNVMVISQNSMSQFISDNDADVSSIRLSGYVEFGVGTRVRVFINNTL